MAYEHSVYLEARESQDTDLPDQGRELEPIEPLRTWPDECPHRELAVTGIPAVFKCLECDEKIPAPELAETRPLHAVD